MNRGKSVLYAVASAALLTSVGAFTAVGYAASDYAPVVMGNSEYSNHVDNLNDYVVEGITYTAPIASQNAETVAEARTLSVTMGTDSESASPIEVINGLGMGIKELSYCSSADTSFPGNMLSGSLSNGESACWYYDYVYKERDFTISTGVSYVVPENYSLQAVLDDGTKAVFHNLNLNGVRTIKLCYSDDYDVYFAERTTITNHTPDPNLFYEVNLKDHADDEAGFDLYVNSCARLGDREYTESRGNGWDVGHAPLQDIADYSIDLPLYGIPQGDFTDGMYDELAWNSDSLTWRKSNNA